MPTPLKILVLEDREADAQLMLHELRQAGYTPHFRRVDNEADFTAALDPSLDVILADCGLPGWSGSEALAVVQRSGFDIPVIIVSGTLGDERAVAMMKQGATDYVLKDRLVRLGPVVVRAINELHLRRERQRVEADLIASEVRYRRLFESAKDGLLVLNANTGAVVDVNSSLMEWMGATREELLGRKLWEIHPLRPVVPDRARFVELQRQSHAHREEGALAAADGRRIEVEFSCHVYPVDHHRLMQCSFRDITTRKKAEETQRLQSAALTAAANAIFITDRQGAIAWANPAFTAMTGYPFVEAIGRNQRELSHSGRNDRKVYAQLWQTILDGKVWQGELVNHRKDGSLYPVAETITPVWGSDGAITHFIAIQQNLAERKHAEAELQHVNRALRASNACHHALVHATSEDALLRDICQVVVEQGGYRMAWVGFAENDDDRSVRRVASAGEEAGYLANAHISWADTERGRGPTGTAIRTGQPSVCQSMLSDPRLALWRESARQRGYESSVGLPLVDAGRVIGALTIYAAEPEAFATAEASWLMRLGEDIGHGIGALRARRERQAAEEALRATEQKFQSVFEQAAVGVVIASGPRGRFLHVNRRFCELVGYPAAELLELSSEDITHPEDVAADTARLDQFSTGNLRDFSLEKRYRRKDGSVVWARVFVAPLDPSETRPTLRIGVIEDITERKQSEVAMRQSEERYRLLFDHNPLPLWVWEAQTLRFLAANETCVERYGYSREELLGMTIDQIRPPEDVAALRQALAKSSDGTCAVTCRHRKKDGSIIHVDVHSQPLKFEGRDARLVLAVDITEKKVLEEKFLRAQRLESLGMLAAGIAHDLNNVLAPIVFAAPLLRGSLSAPRDLKVLNTLEQSAARGTGLVKQILGFAQSTTGQFQTTQVKHLARDIISIVEETFPKTIELSHEVPTDLWPVLGDPTQIHQVLLNLCVNARDAMPHGGTLGIQLANRWLDAGAAGAIPGARPGAWLVVEVTDTGTGIPPEVLARIWEPFFTTKGPGKGTGLGLATVRGIVASHNGFIELLTAVGRGTTFRVFLPVADSGLTCPTSVAPFTVPRGRGELTLVVDDDAFIRDSVTEILVRHGYRVTSCADGIDAIAIYATRVGEISLIVTDSDMPHLGGESLTRAILGIRSDARIVAMSGLSGGSDSDPDFKSCREAAHAFLAKPFSTEALLGTVHRVLHPPAHPDNGALSKPARTRRNPSDTRRHDPAAMAGTTSE